MIASYPQILTLLVLDVAKTTLVTGTLLTMNLPKKRFIMAATFFCSGVTAESNYDGYKEEIIMLLTYSKVITSEIKLETT